MVGYINMYIIIVVVVVIIINQKAKNKIKAKYYYYSHYSKYIKTCRANIKIKEQLKIYNRVDVLLLLLLLLLGSKVYMIASTVSSKLLRSMAEIEGFQFRVSS